MAKVELSFILLPHSLVSRNTELAKEWGLQRRFEYVHSLASDLSRRMRLIDYSRDRFPCN